MARIWERSILRDTVYDAIDGERKYQDDRRGNSARETQDTNRDLGSLILLTEEYLAKARKSFSGPHPEGRIQALRDLRKVTALGVLAMELHGVETRDAEEKAKNRGKIPG